MSRFSLDAKGVKAVCLKNALLLLLSSFAFLIIMNSHRVFVYIGYLHIDLELGIRINLRTLILYVGKEPHVLECLRWNWVDKIFPNLCTASLTLALKTCPLVLLSCIPPLEQVGACSPSWLLLQRWPLTDLASRNPQDREYSASLARNKAETCVSFTLYFWVFHCSVTSTLTPIFILKQV